MADKSASPTHESTPSAPKAAQSAPSVMAHPVQQLQGAAGNRAVAAAIAGGGAPLDSALRVHFQQTLGRDFSDVRIHSGNTRGIHARAFTAGSDIVFGEGQYRPETAEGKHLLAHELTHVAQQQGRGSADAPIGGHDHPLEAEADRAAADVVQGKPVSVSSHTGAPAIRRSPPEEGEQALTTPAPQAAEPVLLFQPSIASQYPNLILLLPEADIVGLEAASELRYSGGTTGTEQTAASTVAKTSVEISISTLLTPQAQFVDEDVWATFYEFVKAGQGDRLTGELARNEMMRRYFERFGLTLAEPVTIELRDPEGKVPGPSRLRFSIKGTTVSDSLGLIAPTDLTDTFGSIETEITEVSADAEKVALAAKLMVELEEVEPLATALAAGVTSNPADHALNEVRGMAARLHYDWQYVELLGTRIGPDISETEGVPGRYEALITEIDAAVTTAEAWHEANPVGESLGMWNERVGTSLAGTAESEWEEGGTGYVTGGLAYAGAFGVAFLDVAETILSVGYHDTATAVGEAYVRGDISYNEAWDVATDAALRALLVAAVTRGIGAAGSRLGVLAAGSLGIAARTTMHGIVAGGVGGTFTGAGAVAAQALVTKSHPNDFASPVGQAIWNQGMPTSSDLLLSMAGGAVLGSGFGVWGVHAANARLIGTIVDTPSGPMRVIAITKQGFELLEPIGGPIRVPAGGTGSFAGSTVLVPPGWRPSSIVPAGEGTAMQTVSQPFTGFPLSLGPQPYGMLSGEEPYGMLPMGQEPYGVSPVVQEPYGMLPAGPEPFGMLPAGPEPFGYLTAGPQPIGMLPPPLTPPEWLLAPEGRYIPGTPGSVIGGSAKVLGPNMMENWNLPRSTSRSGWQPHHIIPTEWADHKVLVKIGMNLDDPSNGILLPEPTNADWTGGLTRHRGYHAQYNTAAKEALDAMDVTLPERVLELQVFRLQQRLRAALESGELLYRARSAPKSENAVILQRWRGIAR